MQAVLLDHYTWIKAAHVVAVIAWMAGMLYLPRLFVYHAGVAPSSAQSETFKVMEARLLRLIINPAMFATYLFGILMVTANPALLQEKWLHGKLALVVLMTITHVFFARWRKAFATDRNLHPAKFFRIWNEIPTALMVLIVILVIVKPF